MFSDKIYRHFFSELSKHFFIVLFASILSIYAGVSDDFNYHYETIKNYIGNGNFIMQINGIRNYLTKN